MVKFISTPPTVRARITRASRWLPEAPDQAHSRCATWTGMQSRPGDRHGRRGGDTCAGGRHDDRDPSLAGRVAAAAASARSETQVNFVRRVMMSNRLSIKESLGSSGRISCTQVPSAEVTGKTLLRSSGRGQGPLRVGPKGVSQYPELVC